MKRVAIVQSNYLPWKGYFDLIASVDEFILYDDVQYTRRDWRNRNQIKTARGLSWLTVPVQVKGKYLQTVRETLIDGQAWGPKHLKAIEVNYGKTPGFADVHRLLSAALTAGHTHLSALNRDLIERVMKQLGISSRLRNSWDYQLIEGRSERLADLCAQAGGTVYVSGPSAKNYLDEGVFRERGITVEWFEYSGYPAYPQLFGAFTHTVSIVDLLCNCGTDAPKFMKHVAR